MAKREKRLTLTPLGEYFADLLIVDSWLDGRSQAMQGTSHLISVLQQREVMIRERVEYLAKKRGIKPDEMWLQILKGEAEPLEPLDISE